MQEEGKQNFWNAHMATAAKHGWRWNYSLARWMAFAARSSILQLLITFSLNFQPEGLLSIQVRKEMYSIQIRQLD
jgi:hypothetical protein